MKNEVQKGLTEVVETLSARFLNSIIAVGTFFLSFFALVSKAAKAFYRKFLRTPVIAVKHFLLKIRKRETALYQKWLKSVYGVRRFFRSMYNVLRSGYRQYPEKSVPLRVFSAGAAFCHAARRHVNLVFKALNYIVPAVSAVVFVFIVQYAFSLNFAIGVEYNGQHIGYIQDESVFQETEAKIQSRLVYQSDDQELSYHPRFTLAIVPTGTLMTSAELTDTIISASGTDVVEATGLVIDGKFVGAVKDISAVKEHLDSKLAAAKQSETDRVEFTKAVEMEEGLYFKSNVVSEEDLIALIDSNTQVDRYYTVQEGDAPLSIAEKNDVTLNELVALNPDILTNCPVGRSVLINKSESYLPVKRIVTITYEETISYSTEYIDTSSLYKGQKQTKTSGQNGTRSITADVSYVDGVEIGREILSSEVTAQPVNEVILRGTASLPTTSGGGNPSKYGLIWPTSGSGRYISSPYGGSRNHKAIDICYYGGAYGKTIVAAHSGTVTYAGWKPSYGYVVFIQSGSVTTVYAHCSKLAVSTGQTVTQGQYIANIGSTGYSTGPHLHFEVRINGSHVNPARYLP